MNDDLNRDDRFVERVSAPLRRPEHGDETFAERVLSAVRGSAPDALPRRSWWLRSHTVQLSPLAGLAMAAGFMLAAVGIVTLAQRNAARVAAAPAVDTVHVVRFVLADTLAREVMLVGTFNDWTKEATPLTREAGGVWTVSLPLPSGRHEYAFVVRDSTGERWAVDPYAALMRYEFGTENSVVSVGST